MMRTYFAPAPRMRGYAPRRSLSDASGCSIAVSSGWVAAEAEPAPTRAKRAQQRATAIRVCLQIRNVSSGEERPRDPAGLLRRGFASLEDPADQVSRFPRTQTRRRLVWVRGNLDTWSAGSSRLANPLRSRPAGSLGLSSPDETLRICKQTRIAVALCCALFAWSALAPPPQPPIRWTRRSSSPT